LWRHSDVMDLTGYVDNLQYELLVAAQAGGDDARALAERLVAPLETATRLTLLEALSAAADEITRELAPGSVEVRLRGRDPEFAVTPPPPEPGGPAEEAVPVAPGIGAGEVTAAGAAAAGEPEDGGTARITLRLPTHLKPRIDEAANRAGLSANAWLVRVVSAALQPDDLRGGGQQQFGNRYRGWVR
jgi:hypothetical protein